MGAGYHGGFGSTAGAAAGDAIYPSPNYNYITNISRRKDIDKDGVFDVVAHGSSNTIQLLHNGEIINVDSRIAAKLIAQNPKYSSGGSLRLLSCNTGSTTKGFAQNLANKLNVIVYAPTKVVWAYPNGHYIVAGRRKDNPDYPDLSDLGSFVTFFPGGKRK